MLSGRSPPLVKEGFGIVLNEEEAAQSALIGSRPTGHHCLWPILRQQREPQKESERFDPT